MIDIKSLRQQKADVVATNSKLLQLAESANRDLATIEMTEYEANNASITALNARIERAEAQMDAERNLSSAHTIQVGHNRAEDKPWATMHEQFKAIRGAAVSRGRDTDVRLLAATGGSESVDSEGGFLIAPEFAPGVWQRIYDTGSILSRTFDQPMTSNRLIINAVDEDSRVDGSRWGGVQSYYVAEAGGYTGVKPKFRQMELIANKLTCLVYGTDEQLEDSTAFQSYIDSVVPQEIAFSMENKFINGSGAGAPLGVLNSGCLVTVPKDAGDTAGSASIDTQDIFNMWAALWHPCRKDSAWLINQEIEPKLWNLSRGSGTAVELLYTAPGERGNNGNFGVMMGRPVIPVEYCAALGTPGDIILGSWSQYCHARKADVRCDTSIHVAFLTGEQAFRWQLRHDGQPFWKKPLTPFKGTPSKTYSPFIALSTRS